MAKAEIDFIIPGHPIDVNDSLDGFRITTSRELDRGLTVFSRKTSQGLVLGVLDRVRPCTELASDVDFEQIFGWVTAQSCRYSYCVIESVNLRIVTDPMGMCPLFYSFGSLGEFRLSFSARTVQDRCRFTGIEPKFSSGRPLPDQGRTVFNGVFIVPPASVVSFIWSSGEWSKIDEFRSFDLPTHASILSPDTAVDSIRQNLIAAVNGVLGDEKRLSATLSGGVDSASVVCLAAAAGREIDTYTVGTPFGNEFDLAAVTASSVGARHHEFTLTSDALKELLPELILGLETWDPLTLQIAAPTVFLYKMLNGARRTFLNGYGSDLIFAGVLKPSLDLRTAELMLRQQIALTVPTNEMSPYLAAQHGVTVRCPFWNPTFLRSSMLVSAELKMLNGIEKWIFRKAIDGLVPPEVVWRKKLGIHEGARMDMLFAQVLGSGKHEEQLVRLFSMAQELFGFDRTAPGHRDASQTQVLKSELIAT